MMTEFIRELNKNYLRITHDMGETSDYSMKMVENNAIEGLLPVRRTAINNKESFLYDISGRMPLEEKYTAKEFSAEDILLIAGSIKAAIDTMERYMLDINGIVFDIKYIFCGINDATWSYVYNSDMHSDARGGIKTVFEYLLGRLDHKDSSAVILGYGLYKRVCRDEIPLSRLFENMEEFGESKERTQNPEYELNTRVYPAVAEESVSEEVEKKIPDRGFIAAALLTMTGLCVTAGLIWGGAVAVVVAAACILCLAVVVLLKLKGPSWEKIVTSELRLPYEVENPQIKPRSEKNIEAERKNIKVNKKNIQAEPENVKSDSGNIRVYMENIETEKESRHYEPQEQATVVLGMVGGACLRRIPKAGQAAQEYMLMENSMSIGSGTAADIVIRDSGISRLHARVTREGDMYFIKDMNSTNGTWVNDRRLSVYELCPVRNGDIIRLAQSSFELIDTTVQ